MRDEMAILKLPFTRQDEDRRGNIRWYYVRPGQKKIRLNPKGVDAGSSEFFKRYEAAHGNKLKGKESPAHRVAGTIAHLVDQYISSPQFQMLRPNTQTARSRILGKLSEEYGDMPAAMSPKTIRAARNARSGTPAAANEWVKVMSAMYSWGADMGYVEDNPAKAIKRLKMNTAGHRAWTVDEIELFRTRWEVGTRERLAFELLYQTAQRIGDVARMGPQHVAGDTIRVTQEKTETRLVIPITAPLAEAMRPVQPKGMRFIGYKSSASLGNMFREWRKLAGLPNGCTAHGLRATRATDLANEGKTAHQIMAITGHKSLSEVQKYTKAADQERLAREALGEQIVPRGIKSGTIEK